MIPARLELHLLDDSERSLVDELVTKLTYHEAKNRTKLAYYEGDWVVRQFGISIPPTMQNVRTPVGWSGTVVDVIEERLDWFGWSGNADLGLRDVYAANSLDVDAPMAHLDALLYGSSFVAVGRGDAGEPDPLVTMQSPRNMTAVWDKRSRRVSAAVYAEAPTKIGEPTDVTLYLPDQTVRIEYQPGRTPIVVDRDMHRLGRVPVVQLENRARTGVHGRSEITHSVRYLCDAAARTMLGMEVSSAFYAAPKLAALNVAEEMLQDEAGNPVSQWTAIMGRVWTAPPNAPGEAEPKLVPIPAASPAPYIDQIAAYARQLAAECGFPESYLGQHTANPSSADAIRALESRLVKRVERRQKAFGRGWMEVARLALLVRDGEIDPAVNELAPDWRDAATPTRAASADEATKLVAAGVLAPDSKVTYSRIGLSPAEQRQVEAEKRTARVESMMSALAQAAPDVPQLNADTGL